MKTRTLIFGLILLLLGIFSSVTGAIFIFHIDNYFSLMSWLAFIGGIFSILEGLYYIKQK